MEDNLDKALKVEVLAEMLNLDRQKSAEMVETLAKMLETALPEHTSIKRAGWFMSKTRPVAELSVQFDSVGYLIERSNKGTITAKHQKIVRGIALKSSDMPLEDCMNQIVEELKNLAEKSSTARMALNHFLEGRY